MGNHPFNVIVVIFWLATMSWLVVAKVLPPLRVGEPPSYTSILQPTAEDKPVCWSIRLGDRTVGWAANMSSRRKNGVADSLYSRVYLGEFPWEEIAPPWLGTVLKPALADLAKMDLDKRSTMTVDPLGRLVGFESRLRVANITDAIKLRGQIEGSNLKLSVQSGEFTYKTDRYLPPNAMMSDELSPQARMPGLRVGQTWTVPLYSPFRAPNSPLEILQAEVVREEIIQWGGERVNTRLIVYRGDSGSGLSGNESRARAWVRDDGAVLHQEITIMKSRLHFMRLGSQAAEPICEALEDNWTGVLPPKTARRLLQQLLADSP